MAGRDKITWPENLFGWAKNGKGAMGPIGRMGGIGHIGLLPGSWNPKTCSITTRSRAIGWNSPVNRLETSYFIAKLAPLDKLHVFHRCS